MENIVWELAKQLGIEIIAQEPAEVAGLPVMEFDYIRGRAKIPLRGPDD